LNQIAEIVIQRIQDKLRGLEFHNPNKSSPDVEMQQQIEKGMQPARGAVSSHMKSFQEQVDILIKQATSYENLASVYVGWCPYW